MIERASGTPRGLGSPTMGPSSLAREQRRWLPWTAAGRLRDGALYQRLFIIGFLIGCAIAGSLVVALVFGDSACRAPVLDAPLALGTLPASAFD